ncbi:CatB-related O-acetyltransferase [Akkermansiaceae bacterium]|nr:CatB-related O-acetyltransferase [Akkermansiaceae bacterium]
MPSTRGPIIIENDVWIGTGATILSGVTIGNGAVILAGALVTNNVAAYTIVGGVPAKNVRQRFSDDEIAALEKIKWWTWSEHKLKQNINLLSSGDISLFIDKNRIKD